MTPAARTRSTARRRTAVALAACALLVTASACFGDDTPAGPTTAAATTSADPAATDAPPETPDEPEPSDGAVDPKIVEVPTVTVTVTGTLASGLQAPWGLAGLPDGSWLVTERDSRRLLVVPEAGGDPAVVTGPGADDLVDRTTGTGEGGLLGVAVSPTFDEDGRVFLYRTAEDGNEVVRGELDGTTLGALTPILTGIPAASTHDGGRLAFGPDGYLYVTTGDAGDRALAQDPDSLAGTILRVTADGAVPRGNPVPGSPVWSLGHRNVQGIGWSADGRMFASELGQDALDELNLVVPGGSYGWPDVEGPGGTEDGFVDPLVTWTTSDASPSGLAVTDEGVYVAALRGQALLRVPLAADGVGVPQRLLDGELGRLRAVAVAPDGTLRVLTSSTDGRGEPTEDDDRLLVVRVDR